MEVRLSQRALRGEGQPISDLMSRALSDPEVISLAAGFVDEATLPIEAVRTAGETLSRDGAAARAALQYGTTPGLPALREAILAHRPAREDVPVALEQIVLTAGSNQLLHLVAQALLDPGDIVLASAPTYFVFLGTIGELGARAWGVAADEQGMIPEALEEAFSTLHQQGLLPRVKLVYLVPYFDNPTGAIMPWPRRVALVDLVRRWSRDHRIPIMADDAYRDLRYDGEDIPPLRGADEAGDLVIEAGTFSKSFSPGIRVGWGILPPDLVAPVLHLKGNLDFGSAHWNQYLMHRVLVSGSWERHIMTLRDGYRTKREAMLRALEHHLGDLPGVAWRGPIENLPSGGLYVWLTLPDELTTRPGGRLWKEALRERVLYVPGHYCYPPEGVPPRDNALRLSFGVQSREGIDRGVAALGRAVRKLLADNR